MFQFFKNTKYWSDYWRLRKIDWQKSYTSTWQHPHRYIISGILHTFPWISLLEIGCGSGANLINIIKQFPNRQLGGIDINPEAIEQAQKTFTGAFLKVGSLEDIMISDNATDVVLSDMALMYIDPFKIDKAINEIKRITRKYVIFCELHSSNLYDRIRLRLTSGYNAYNYKKLLTRHGFYDIEMMKVTEEIWPNGQPQKTFGYIIKAKISKRK